MRPSASVTANLVAAVLFVLALVVATLLLMLVVMLVTTVAALIHKTLAALLVAAIFLVFAAMVLVVLVGGAYVAWRDTFGEDAPAGGDPGAVGGEHAEGQARVGDDAGGRAAGGVEAPGELEPEGRDGELRRRVGAGAAVERGLQERRREARSAVADAPEVHDPGARGGQRRQEPGDQRIVPQVVGAEL